MEFPYTSWIIVSSMKVEKRKVIAHEEDAEGQTLFHYKRHTGPVGHAKKEDVFSSELHAIFALYQRVATKLKYQQRELRELSASVDRLMALERDTGERLRKLSDERKATRRSTN